jgi:hypothetical protein
MNRAGVVANQSPTPVVQEPSASDPSRDAPIPIAIDYWEVMFSAVVETLTTQATEQLGDPATACGLPENARTNLLDCVESLGKLKSSLILERDRRRDFESQVARREIS